MDKVMSAASCKLHVLDTVYNEYVYILYSHSGRNSHVSEPNISPKKKFSA